MLNKLTAISQLKEKFIQERKDVLASDVSFLQKKLYKKLFDKLIAALETEQGSIINNNSNIALTSAIDKIFKDFETELSQLLQKVTGDYTKLIGYNQQYFSQFNIALFNSVKKNVTAAMQARAGFNSSGFEKDGFIDLFIKDKTIARTVKQQVLSGILSGTKISDLTKSLSATINGAGDSPGALENHFKTFINDSYSLFDRETSNQFSFQLDLNYGIYAGGLVGHSREFCIVRNGKVFTREEIRKFGTPQDAYGGYTNKSKGEFAGKWSKGQGRQYIPENDCGCNNCGHLYNWVNYTIAKSMRPDIRKSQFDFKKPA